MNILARGNKKRTSEKGEKILIIARSAKSKTSWNRDISWALGERYAWVLGVPKFSKTAKNILKNTVEYEIAICRKSNYAQKEEEAHICKVNDEIREWAVIIAYIAAHKMMWRLCRKKSFFFDYFSVFVDAFGEL